MKQIGNTWVDRITEEIRTPQPRRGSLVGVIVCGVVVITAVSAALGWLLCQ